MNLYRILIVKDAEGNAQAPQTFEPNKGYYPVQLHGDAYVAADVPPADYEDITSIENWDAFGVLTGKDYKFVRDQIKSIVSDLGGGDIDAGFVLLSNSQKDICCENKIGSQALRVQHTSFEQVQEAGYIYDSKVKEVRYNRFRMANGYMINYLPTDINALFAAQGQYIESVSTAYKEYGVEGTQIGDPTGIGDWIFGTSVFVGGGLINTGYVPLNITLQQLCDKIWDCIHNGNY